MEAVEERQAMAAQGSNVWNVFYIECVLRSARQWRHRAARLYIDLS
jgi:hypothetical protein